MKEIKLQFIPLVICPECGEGMEVISSVCIVPHSACCGKRYTVKLPLVAATVEEVGQPTPQEK